jgi:hypothetical protein
MDGAALRPTDWIEQLGAGWRWWLDTLASFVPRPIHDALSGGEDAIVITVQPAELVVARRAGAYEGVIARIPRDEFAARTLRLSVPHRTGIAAWFADPVVLELPAEEALTRPLRLPRGAARNLGPILKHEVVRQSPIDAQSIYYDYRVVERDAEGVDVALRIIRREPVDALLQLCREAGVAVSAVVFEGDMQLADNTFPTDPAATRRLRRAPKVVPMLFGLLLLLLAGLVLSIYLRGEAAASDLQNQVDAARGGAMAVAALQQKINIASKQAAFLAQQKRNPPTAAVLAGVARLLPDGSWLYEIEMNGSEVRLHGFSNQAASLIALFDASSAFADAQFRSPLMQGPSPNLQRFDLSMRLRKPQT